MSATFAFAPGRNRARKKILIEARRWSADSTTTDPQNSTSDTCKARSS
jgi:hypothetical protein